MRFKSTLLSAFTMIAFCMSGQEMTNDTLRNEAFKEGVFYDIWTYAHSSGNVRVADKKGHVDKDEYFETDEIYVYDYDLVRSLPIEVKKVVALYTSFIPHLFNKEADSEFAQALGGFTTLAKARESLLKDYGKKNSDIQIYGMKVEFESLVAKDSNPTLKASPYSLKIKKRDRKIYAEWYGSFSTSRGIVDEFMIERQGITYIPETPLEKPYGREYLISQYGDYWTLLNGKQIYPRLTYLDAENIESLKVSERDRIVYITQKNKETTYFSLNDIDLSVFNAGIESIKQIKWFSIIDNGKYAGDYSSSILVENSIIDSITIKKNEKYEFYQLSIWLNSQNENDENCLSYSYYDEDINKIVYTQPLIMAGYPGDEKELLRYFSENVKAQKQDDIQGKISLACIIDDDGTVKHIKVKKRTIEDEHSGTIYEYKTEEEYTPYDREFVRVAETMQRWTPAVCGGRNVPSLMLIPIRFH